MPKAKPDTNKLNKLAELIKKWPKLSNNQKAVWAGSLIAAAAILIYLVFSLLFLGRVYPNVYLGQTKLSGLKKSSLSDRVELAISQQKLAEIKLSYQEKDYSISTSEITVDYQTQKAADQAYAVARSHNYLFAFWQQISSPFTKRVIDPGLSFDADLLDLKLDEITSKIDRPATNASVTDFSEKSIDIRTEQAGEIVDRDQLIKTITDNLRQLNHQSIMITTVTDQPSVVVGDKDALHQQALALLDTNLKLTWPGGQKALGQKEIKKMIGFTGQAVDDGSHQVLSAQFTKEAIKSYLAELASSVDKPAKDPKLAIKNGQVVIAVASETGTVIDQDVSTDNILTALTSEPKDSVELTLKAQDPVLNDSNLAGLGIKELIGRGETSFAGSPENRRANINNGVRILQSALVKPGEEFSTVKTLGAVDGSTGFLPELVIKDNKTQPEFGGGLCQVSTTLFRAVLNAGLQVSERSNHSYRVSYYEPPVGLDATIYLPKPDFKFLNDTPASILIQGQVVGSKVIFELWGTRDGRTSSISDSVVTNVKDPGDPIYVDTDTLPKGEIKQVEKAHPGSTAVVVYTVMRDGKEINKQTFKSIYKVWPARFLVGTREDNPAPA